MFFSKMAPLPFPGAVVGTVHSLRSLTAALALRKNAVDFLEVRVDAFTQTDACAHLEKNIRRLRAPLIVTVRHPLEGGAGRLSPSQRRALFQRFLPFASLVDVELRSANSLQDVIAEAQSSGIGVILSHHDFRKTPSLARLRELRQNAKSAGGSIFKVAATTRTPRDLATLLEFLTSPGGASPSLAVMGMGAFGKISRLALGKAGSVLNYGYLDKQQVSGQWPAALLKERLAELSK